VLINDFLSSADKARLFLLTDKALYPSFCIVIPTSQSIISGEEAATFWPKLMHCWP
jgi:hypothetical protein